MSNDDVLAELDGELSYEEIQGILKDAWRDAKNEALNYEQLMIRHQFDDIDLDEIKSILNSEIEGDEHK